MPAKKTSIISGDFGSPIGTASQFSASAYNDGTRKRVSYNLFLYELVGEERVRIYFGDERKWTINIPNSELDALPTEELTAAFLKQRFTDVATHAYERCATPNDMRALFSKLIVFTGI